MSTTYFFMSSTPTTPGPLNKREAWMPKGDVPYYDPTMQMRFESRRHKRQVLQSLGMRECGMTHDPRKAPPEGRMRKRRALPDGVQRTGPTSFVMR